MNPVMGELLRYPVKVLRYFHNIMNIKESINELMIDDCFMNTVSPGFICKDAENLVKIKWKLKKEEERKKIQFYSIISKVYPLDFEQLR